MKSIDELREIGMKVKNSCFTGVHCDAVLELADEIEAEIADNYMRLPLDANNEPIHMGDTVEGEMVFDDATTKGTVTTYHIHDNDEPDTVYIKVDCGNGTWTIKELRIKRCRHVKPRTLEDVLCDMIHEYGSTDALTETVAAKYADEIRELLGGDEGEGVKR